MDKKKILNVAGVVLIGVLSSGVWELVKPLLGWGWDVLLTLATLGLGSIRDGIYEKAATPSYRSGLVQTTWFCIVFIVLGIYAVLVSVAIHAPDASPKMGGYRFTYVLGGVVIVILMLNVVRVIYASQLAFSTVKLEAVAAIFQTDSETKLLRAELSQINSRDSYIVYDEKLRKTIRLGGRVAPIRDYF